MPLSQTTPTQPGFLRRLVFAGTNVFIPAHTALLVCYYAARILGGDQLKVIDTFGYGLPWSIVPPVVLLPAALWRRSRLLSVLAAVPLLLFVLTYGHLFLPRRPIRVEGPTITVMTYNVYYRNPDVDQVAAVIEQGAPDLVGLHELWDHLSAPLESRFADQYPYRRVDSGVGLFSRHPIVTCEAFQMGYGTGYVSQHCLLEIAGHPVNVFNVHVRRPNLKGSRLAGLPLALPTDYIDDFQEKDVLDLLERLEQVDGPVLVLGDLNLTDQQSLYRKLIGRLLDAHRESGWGMGFTYSYSPHLRIPIWRIDYVLYSPDLVALSASVGDYGGSDHRPVIATLGFRQRE